MYKKIFVIFILFFYPQISWAQNDDKTQKVKDFVTILSDKVIKAIKDNSDDFPSRHKAFEDIFSKYGNVPKIARFVAGKSWRPADKEVRDNYTKIYSSYMAYTYAVRLSSYEDQSVIIGRINDLGRKGYLVNTKIGMAPPQQPISVIWQLSNKNEELKVVDLRIENISMSMTQRSEFDSILIKNNYDLSSLSEVLQKRVEYVDEEKDHQTANNVKPKNI